MSEAVDLAAALATFTAPWEPRTVAVLNSYDVRVVKTAGEFTPRPPRHGRAVPGPAGHADDPDGRR